MTAHRYHPDPDRNDPDDAILFDGCPRCTEHALAPWMSLDRFRLAQVMNPEREPVTSTEKECAHVVKVQLERAQYLMRVLKLGKVGDLT